MSVSSQCWLCLGDVAQMRGIAFVSLETAIVDVGARHPHWIVQAKEHAQIGGKTNRINYRTSQPYYNRQMLM